MQTTYEDILNLFRETDAQIKGLAHAQEEISERFRETDAQIKELTHSQKEMHKEISERFRETDEKFRETAERFHETDKKFRETDKRVKELNGLFTSQWGKLIESLVTGDLVNLLNQRGIAITDTSTRLKGKLPNGHQI